ncbi:MAG: (Fe-S)-binding protein, partial [Sphaerochaetaceae bacterium]
FIAPDTIQKSLNLDNDIEIAIHKLEKINEIVKVLPGIDCGLCGAPTCFCLAEDISQKKASIRQCAVLRLRDSQGLNTLAKIWGEKISSN